MPIQTTCPSCNKPLRVPDSLIGKNVKCPSCQTTFVAEVEGGEAPPPLPRESRRGEGIREETPSRRPVREEEEEERPSRRPARRDDDDYEEDDRDRDEDYGEERPRRRRRRRRSTEYAQSKVSGPAICLMITSILGFIFYALAICGGVLQTTGAAPAGGPGQGAFGGGQPAANGPFAIVIGAIGLIWSILVFVGSLQMKALKSRGMAMTGAILALIPNYCCLLSLPFGIWALVVLSDAEVKEAFG
ncbi:MAG TPA: MJ0042-type zinc finger domain-containing protein [Gemmataceae bacterium]|nr:MJ0042-type zinc finger domain-containing protein [Gemmataceae bacterium]